MAKVKKTSTKKDVSLREYTQTLVELKQRIQDAQIKAAFSVNKELLHLYWSIGKTIIEKQAAFKWGTKIIEQLAKDLQNSFPGIQGFSRTNIFYMRAFYVTYELVQEAPGQLEKLPIFNIPWWHNVILITKLKNNTERFWYAKKAIENGWSASMLEHWIENKLFQREGKALNNFGKILPTPESDIANQTLKDPYIFDFLTLKSDHIEKDLEQGLVDHIQKFLIELGQGFAFIGRQVHLQLSGEDYYIDLLFYHVKLHCFFVVELKNTKFIPEYAGKMAFYLNLVDNTLKSSTDMPTLGLLLCKTKNKLTVEYALQTNTSPIGVASYTTKIQESIPKALKGSLPTIEQIEAGLEKQELIAELEKPKKKKSKAAGSKAKTKVTKRKQSN